jgi:hypothetical protein
MKRIHAWPPAFTPIIAPIHHQGLDGGIFLMAKYYCHTCQLGLNSETNFHFQSQYKKYIDCHI